MNRWRRQMIKSIDCWELPWPGQNWFLVSARFLRSNLVEKPRFSFRQSKSFRATHWTKSSSVSLQLHLQVTWALIGLTLWLIWFVKVTMYWLIKTDFVSKRDGRSQRCCDSLRFASVRIHTKNIFLLKEFDADKRRPMTVGQDPTPFTGHPSACMVKSWWARANQNRSDY